MYFFHDKNALYEIFFDAEVSKWKKTVKNSESTIIPLFY